MSKKKITYPIPCVGHEQQCKDILKLIYQRNSIAVYDKMLFETRLIYIPHAKYMRHNVSSSVFNGYTNKLNKIWISTLNYYGRWLLSNLQMHNTSTLPALSVTERELLLSYIYEQYKNTLTNGIKRSHDFFIYMIMDDTPEYLLKDICKKCSKTTRLSILIAAINYMHTMPQWWLEYVKKHSLMTMFGSLASDPEYVNMCTDLTKSYHNLQNVMIIPSKGVES
jgi:hypothetical protein